MTSRNHVTYKDAGVDIDAGNALVKAIGPLARATARAGTESALGGFGAFFDLKAAGYRDPILVAATDGVGTKLKIAIEAECHGGVGVDLVAMCANDLVVQGAEPLFFLDYYATGKLDLETGQSVVAGIAEGCKQAGCALVGGETAEMPGLYTGADYDLAGFCVGAVERDSVLTGASVEAGDLILGLASNGLHSNGFSLVRKVVADLGLSWDAACPYEPEGTLGAALLTPTRIYVRNCLSALAQGGVKAFAHITGGGLIENLPRVLPPGVMADLSSASWPIPPVFGWLSRSAGVPAREMLRTFNCGLGMVAVVSEEAAQGLQDHLTDLGEQVFLIGRIAPADQATPDIRIAIEPEALAWDA